MFSARVSASEIRKHVGASCKESYWALFRTPNDVMRFVKIALKFKFKMRNILMSDLRAEYWLCQSRADSKLKVRNLLNGEKCAEHGVLVGSSVPQPGASPHDASRMSRTTGSFDDPLNLWFLGFKLQMLLNLIEIFNRSYLCSVHEWTLLSYKIGQ